MQFVTKSALAAVLIGLIAPAAAHAQETRLYLSFTPSVASVGGDAELALAGTIGYRFTDHFSFEGDVTWIDAAAGGFRSRVFELDRGALTTTPINTILQNAGSIFGGLDRASGINVGSITSIGRLLPITVPRFPVLSAETDGQTWIGTMGVRYEPMVQTARFRPYVAAGIGLNYTDQRFILENAATTRFDASNSDTGIAFGAGGGANVGLTDQLWLAADARYFRLSRDRNLMRIGGGVTFRF
jgi:opacity protein-like surface antigen